jgi:hypothetical protein
MAYILNFVLKFILVLALFLIAPIILFIVAIFIMMYSLITRDLYPIEELESKFDNIIALLGL